MLESSAPMTLAVVVMLLLLRENIVIPRIHSLENRGEVRKVEKTDA